jgi:hypothetical protein
MVKDALDVNGYNFIALDMPVNPSYAGNLK